MGFPKPLLLGAVAAVAGAFLCSYLLGGDQPQSSPPAPSPSPPRSPSPRRGLRGPAEPPIHPPPRPPAHVSPVPSHQVTSKVCQHGAHQRQTNVVEHPPHSWPDPTRHPPRNKPSPTMEPYQSQDRQYPKIESPRNGESSNEDDERGPYHLRLRSEAKDYYTRKVQLFEESRQAHHRKQGALAKDLSRQGRECERRMKERNQKACNWIFDQNNKDSRPYTVDLHGLYVKEAVDKAKQSLKEARARGDPLIQFIVGKGLHSKGGHAKLKPAIEKFIRESGLSSGVNQSNLGVLIVDLDPVIDQVSNNNVFFRDRANLQVYELQHSVFFCALTL